MKNKIRKSFLAILTTAICLSPVFVVADGGLIPPPDRYVYETDQKAVIFYDQGIENLILQITFEGNAKDFAWIVPTPKQPQVEKSTDTLFTRLDELTRPEERSAPMSAGFGLMNTSVDDVGRSVRVVETKKIEYYDINVLEANDKDALYNWLNDNGYIFPQQGKYIIDDYIQKGWYFTAVKIDNEAVSDLVEGQLQNGHAVPLKLSFETENIVYPLKISAVNGMEDVASDGEISYVDGAKGRGAMIDTDRMLLTDRSIENFSVNKGLLSFFIKKKDSRPIVDLVRIQKGIYPPNIWLSTGVAVSNNGGDHFTFEIYSTRFFHEYDFVLGNDIYKVNQWHKLEFQWEIKPEENKMYVKLFIDDQEKTINQTSSEYKHGSLSSISIKDESDPSENAFLVIGGKYSDKKRLTATMPEKAISEGIDVNSAKYLSSLYFPDHHENLYIDELNVQSGGGDILSAKFMNDLQVELTESKKGKLEVVRDENQVFPNKPKLSPTGILIYVFADKKQEATGFDIQYAGSIKKDEIEELASVDGKPWINPLEKNTSSLDFTIE